MSQPEAQPAKPCWYAVDLEIAPRAEEIITWNLWELGAGFPGSQFHAKDVK